MDAEATSQSFLLVRQPAGDNRDVEHEELLWAAPAPPEARVVLGVCQERCGAGDLVIGSLRMGRGTTRISQTWPFGLVAAQDLTGAPFLEAAGETGADVATRVVMRDVGRGGRFVWFKGVGPPAWRYPRAEVRFERGRVRIRAGWRWTAYQVTWLSARRVAVAHHRRSISVEDDQTWD